MNGRSVCLREEVNGREQLNNETCVIGGRRKKSEGGGIRSAREDIRSTGFNSVRIRPFACSYIIHYK